MRAAATGSTEPEGLRQLSSVAHHIANAGKLVTFCHQFRDVTKLLLCGVHFAGAGKMVRFHDFVDVTKIAMSSTFNS